jgi:EmrB/QacA subfamily drug resistance transporter
MSEKQIAQVAEAIEIADTIKITPALDPQRRTALGIVLIAVVMDMMDGSISTLATPSIKADLGATNADIQWVLAGYTLTFAVLMITGGRLGDIFGRKRMFLTGVAGFTLASALSGMAVSPEMLIASRLLQGLMAAMMLPQVLSIIQVAFPVKERMAAFGLIGAMGGMANVIAPLLAGVLLAVNVMGLSWRPLFLINVPIGICLFVAAYFVLKESKAPMTLKLDFMGVGIITVSLLMLMYPLVQGNELGWPLWTYVLMTLSVPGFIAFAVHEIRKNRADGSPLVVPELFRIPAFVGGSLICLIMMSGLLAFFFTTSVYMQSGLGYSALETGLTMVAWPICIIVSCIAAMKLGLHYGRKIMSAGTLMMVASAAVLYVRLSNAGAPVSPFDFLPCTILGGLGMGMIMPLLTDYVLAKVPVKHAGSASGVANTFNELGSAMGIAVVGTVFFGALGSGYTEAIKEALLLEAIIFLAGFFLVFLLPKNVRQGSGEEAIASA